MADLGKTLGEELLTPTEIYVSTILSLLRDLPIHGLVHVTGGGIDENIIRVIPDACKAIVNQASWERPKIFDVLQKEGKVSDQEMHRTFNNGIGMVVVVPEKSAQDVMDRLAAMDEKAYLIGEVQARENNEVQTLWV